MPVHLCECATLNCAALPCLAAGGTLQYGAVLDTCADVAKALQHLHSLNVLHRDIKVGGWVVLVFLYMCVYRYTACVCPALIECTAGRLWNLSF